MTQCILRERLKDQVRDECLRRSWIDVELDAESIGKSHLLNTQIKLREVDLFPQFDFMPRGVFERVTQEVAQPHQHADRSAVLIVTDETDDTVERVEEKMRVQLHSQCIQLRLRELSFKSRRHKLALAIFAIVVERVKDPNDRAIHEQVRTDRSLYAPKEARPKSHGAGTHVVERLDR